MGAIHWSTGRKDLSVQDTDAKREKFIKQYPENQFNIAKTCRAIGIHRQTYYLWRKENPNFEQEIIDYREGLIDHVESALLKAAFSGNIVAQIFFLKTQGKHRGYIERPSEDPGMDQEIDKELLIKQTKQFLIESGEAVD